MCLKRRTRIAVSSNSVFLAVRYLTANGDLSASLSWNSKTKTGSHREGAARLFFP
jgi:hypothetical protein